MTQGPGVSIATPTVSGSIDVPTGSILLSRIHGFLGRSAAAAQAFARDGSRWTHVSLYLGEGRLIQAEPGGARIRPVTEFVGGREVRWSDAPIQRHLTGLPSRDPRIERELRESVVAAALSMQGAPYCWSAYLAIALPGWRRLRRTIEDGDRLLCSALVDRAFRLAGIELFPERRPGGEVTPADLADLDETWVRERLAALEGRVAAIETQLPIPQPRKATA